MTAAAAGRTARRCPLCQLGPIDGKDRSRKSRRHRRIYSGGSAEKHFGPLHPGLIKRAGRQVANATLRQQGGQAKRFACAMRELRGGEPAEMFRPHLPVVGDAIGSAEHRLVTASVY